MKKSHFFLIVALAFGLALLDVSAKLCAQGARAGKKSREAAAARDSNANNGQEYSGMYSFLKDGEFVQVTVEDAGHVSGFISRFGDGESDKGAFLDQFFKSGKIDGNQLNFTTDIFHGVGLDR